MPLSWPYRVTRPVVGQMFHVKQLSGWVAAWPYPRAPAAALLALFCCVAAVCARGRRPAREIATREPVGSECSISKPGQAPPPPTGTAATLPGPVTGLGLTSRSLHPAGPTSACGAAWARLPCIRVITLAKGNASPEQAWIERNLPKLKIDVEVSARGTEFLLTERKTSTSRLPLIHLRNCGKRSGDQHLGIFC